MDDNMTKRRIAGRLLRRFIDENFESHKDFAFTFGAPQTSVSNWINGRANIPTYIIERLGERFPDELKLFKKLKPELF